MKMWGGRMSKSTDPLVERFNASASFDIRLAKEDIAGSVAWAQALGRAGVLGPDDLDVILRGLAAVLEEFAAGRFNLAPADEDVHTAVERRLTELIGPAAGKLHTGRSRNDQVATDFRLWCQHASSELTTRVVELQEAILDGAEADLHTPMPGYTHLRQAQPVTWGHWMLSHFWALGRDIDRLGQARAAAACLPLGSGALAGTSVRVDRALLAEELGFHTVSANSLDAVSDRDFVASFLFACGLMGVHISRLSEALILFSSREFGFVELDEAFTTGSSLMPHKANPDPLELARGKVGRLIGNLTALLTVLKGLPSAYDKDLQEDKEPTFDSFDTLMSVLPVLSGLVRSLRTDRGRMAAAIAPEAYTVDVADYLVERGVPFREAHASVGKALRLAEEKGRELNGLTVEEWQSVDPRFDEGTLRMFDLSVALDRRDATGGTSRRALREQLASARARLAECKGAGVG
jgi:argininosuccinate lyase